MATPSTDNAGADILRIILSIILPPVGVAMQVGFTTQFWINVVLTLLGYIPGIIHALWIILRR
ncbi:MAG: YqaE/Pmp3 family membrane protein [Amphiplicatus sp.]